MKFSLLLRKVESQNPLDIHSIITELYCDNHLS